MLAALAAVSASLVFAGQPQSAQARPAANQAPTIVADRGAEAAPAVVTDDSAVQFAQIRTVAARLAAGRVRAAAIAAALTYTVKPGESMSAVAQRRCGQARKWTGIYAASRARGWTARNANVLNAGQHLWLSCEYVPSMLKYAPAPPPPPVVRTAARVVYSGYHSTYHRTYHRVYATSTYHRVYAAVSGAGVYSYAGLESLWMSAGGPSWAAAHAAEIAECESGGRVNAYNQSGATGLWQILGSVVGGSLYNPYVNALNAVAKFRASGGTFAQWVCR
jgi:hypothetical protein